MHIDYISLVYIARTTTTCNKVIATHTKERNSSSLYHWQRLSVILQQHKALTCHLSSYRSVSLKVRLVTELITLKSRGLYNHLKDAGYALIEVSLLQCTLLYSLYNRIKVVRLARLNHIVTRSHLRRSIKTTTPICYNHTLKAELATENILQQTLILRCIATIQIVVRGHYCPRLRLLNGNLEVTQIYLTQCTLRDASIICQTVNLLIISTEVLERSTYTIALHSVDNRRSSLTS